MRAPDPVEPVEDLTAPFSVEGNDEVERPGRDVRRPSSCVPRSSRPSASAIAVGLVSRSLQKVSPPITFFSGPGIERLQETEPRTGGLGLVQAGAAGRVGRERAGRGRPRLEDRVAHRPRGLDLVIARDEGRIAARASRSGAHRARALGEEAGPVAKLHVHRADPHPATGELCTVIARRLRRAGSSSRAGSIARQCPSVGLEGEVGDGLQGHAISVSFRARRLPVRR